jgi:hypothetical protein
VFYGVAFLFSLALLIFAVLDCIATDASLCRNLPKTLWILLIIFLPTIGSVAWLLLGRPEKTRFLPGDTRFRAGPQPRPKRPLGPDDDPRFLEMTGGPVAPAVRPPVKSPEASETPTPPNEGHPSGAVPPAHGVNELKAWEEDLVRREQELRRKLEERPPEG